MVREEPEAAIAKTLRLVVMENTRKTSFAVLCHPQLFVVKCISNHGERKQILRLPSETARPTNTMIAVYYFAACEFAAVSASRLNYHQKTAAPSAEVKCHPLISCRTTRHGTKGCSSDNAVRSEHAVGATQMSAIPTLQSNTDVAI